MLKEVIRKWNQNKDTLKANLLLDEKLSKCDYTYLVKTVVDIILNDDKDMEMFNIDKIEVIDHGDYQGTVIYIIPKSTYQPNEGEYLVTYVNYGSCSGCDTLLEIQSNYNDKCQQVDDYMSLCLHLIENMKKIYPSNYSKVWDEEC